MKRFACLAFVFVAACGDDETTPTDAANIDAAVDAGIDAAVDAPPTVYSGTITALEAKILNPGNTGTFFGQGVQIGISFQDSVTGVAPTMEEQPGSPLGCKLFEFNRAQAIQSSVGNNEGSVTIKLGAETYPACNFTANVGYTCPHLGTAGTGGTIAAGPQAGTFTLTVTGTPYNAGNTTNRYVSISGATNAANNGVFPIVGLAAPNIIVYGNQAGVAEVTPAASQHVNLAGVGPTPGAPADGFLANDATADFTVAPGGGNHFAAFTASTPNVGDDLVLPATELAKLNSIPVNGTAFTFGCDAQTQGHTCNSASGALINIVTTDSSVAGLSPFTLPLPTTKRVQVRCAAIGATKVTVPAAYMAAIQNSGYTRIQTTFMRPALMTTTPATATVNALGGHAIVGFTGRPN